MVCLSNGRGKSEESCSIHEEINEQEKMALWSLDRNTGRNIFHFAKNHGKSLLLCTAVWTVKEMKIRSEVTVNSSFYTLG